MSLNLKKTQPKQTRKHNPNRNFLCKVVTLLPLLAVFVIVWKIITCISYNQSHFWLCPIICSWESTCTVFRFAFFYLHLWIKTKFKCTNVFFCYWYEWVQEWLIGQGVMLPARGTLTGWKNGLTEISWSSTRRSLKCWTWGGTSPCTNIRWVPPGWQAALQKKKWRFCWRPSWTLSSNMPW